MIDRFSRRRLPPRSVLALLTMVLTVPATLMAHAAAPGDDGSPAHANANANGAAKPARTPDAARRVRVVATGRAEDVAALGATLRELLGRLGVSARVETVSADSAHAPTGEPGDFAAVGVDLSGAGGALVVVADGTGQEQMRRTLPASSDRAASIEETAHVVQAAIEALTERETTDAEALPPVAQAAADAGAPASAMVPPAPDAATPVIPTPSRAPTTTPPAPVTLKTPADLDDAASAKPEGHPHFGLDVLGALDTTIDGERSGVIIGGEAGVIVRRARDQSRWWPSLWIVGDYHATFRAIRDDVLVDVTMVSARFLPTLALARGDSWLVEGGLGAGFDVVVAEPGTTQPVATQLAPDRTDVDPILTAMIAAHTAVASSADLFIAARLDVDLGTERYELASHGGPPVTVFDPWTFRPELLVGFSLGVVGAPDYPARTIQAATR